jgi:hypothetical protein
MEAGARVMGISYQMLIMSSILSIIITIIELIFGILAIKFCGVPEKAKLLFTLGLIMLVIAVISFVVSLITYSGTAAGTTMFTGVIGFILPILYALGGRLNMTSLPPQGQGQPPYGGQPPQNPGQPPQA